MAWALEVRETTAITRWAPPQQLAEGEDVDAERRLRNSSHGCAEARSPQLKVLACDFAIDWGTCAPVPSARNAR